MAHANVAVFIPHLGCPHQCSFCNQRSITGRQRAPLPEEVAGAAGSGALMAARSNGKTEREFAFFGGSFTAVPRAYMLALLQAVQPYLQSGAYNGIRISTRPDAVDAEILALLKQYGVTAIELGAQSMQDGVLRRNGRGHTARQVAEAAERISAAGFSLGLQMMTGLDGDTPAGCRETAVRLAALEPETMRLYPAIVMEGTELARRWRAGMYEPMSLECAVNLCADLLDFFEQRQIRVIRLGLHASPELERDRLAGPWHPAFRELCESRRLRKQMDQLLRTVRRGPVVFQVNPRSRSKAVGQKKSNVQYLQAMGYEPIFQMNELIPENRIEL